MSASLDGLPARIKIGPFEITINVGKLDGEWGNYNKHNITIDAEHPNHVCLLDTVMHEINHAIWEIYWLDAKAREERGCRIMATAWLQILRDNPDLRRWLWAGFSVT